MTGEMLKEWRESQDLTQAELAALLSVDVMTISRWERGARTIPPYLNLALQQIEHQSGETVDMVPSPEPGKPQKSAKKK